MRGKWNEKQTAMENMFGIVGQKMIDNWLSPRPKQKSSQPVIQDTKYVAKQKPRHSNRRKNSSGSSPAVYNIVINGGTNQINISKE